MTGAVTARTPDPRSSRARLRGLEVDHAALGVVRAEVIGRRIVIHERDVETRTSQVVGDDAHVVGDAEVVVWPGWVVVFAT